MGSLYLILALIFSLLIAIIALANNEIVTVSYIFGRSEVSLIVLILGSSFFGALVMGLFSLFRSIKSAISFRGLRQKNEELQKQVKTLEEEKLFLQAELNSAVSVPEEANQEEQVQEVQEKNETGTESDGETDTIVEHYLEQAEKSGTGSEPDEEVNK